MVQIGFIAPDPLMLEYAAIAVENRREAFYLEHGLLSKGVIKARQLAEKGVELFISRGATARGIAEALPHCTVVMVPITGFDLLRAWHAARKYGERVGVVAFSEMTRGIGCLNELLDARLTVFPLEKEEEIEERVAEAKSAGMDALMGGIATALVADRVGIPSIVVRNGLESITESITEALRISRALEQEKARNLLREAVITYADNGIIAIDTEGRVTLINPRAEKMARRKPGSSTGALSRDIWPELRLEESLTNGGKELGNVIKSFGRDIICNKIPLTVNGKTLGAVATFHDAHTIRKMEATVRNKALDPGHKAIARFSDILGDSTAIRRAISVASDYALTDATVLIQGETGTGKELFAQSIHNHGHRSGEPFLAVNCAALPVQLLESELFGYAGGAFTGANPKGKAGLLELAHGGTVFLDEIAELEQSTQGKILRVLQEKRVMRLGDDHLMPVNVRIIAATNKDLRAMVEAGSFRDDLYYRLNVLRLVLPPLRERASDIPALARRLLSACTRKHGGPPELAPGALDALCRYSWPGNIRELQNVMERISATVASATVDAGIIHTLMDDARPGCRCLPGEDAEAEDLRAALIQCRGRAGKAAELLGISRSTLWRRRKALGV